jgi:HEPN domain-containing protein
MREEVGLWLKQAEADLQTAEKLLQSNVYYASVFFSQQAAEKFVKACWIHLKGELPPKSHNIVNMIRELGGKEDLIDAAAELTPE